jgi:putative ABC transport system permease protein
MAGPINWLSQVGSITKFGLMSVPQRLGASLATVVGIGLVVGVFVGLLSMGAGFKHALRSAGGEDTVIVLRSGADSEMVSGFTREDTRLIMDAPGVAQSSNGPVASSELFVLVNAPKKSTHTDANVPVRGVDPASLLIRDKVKIVDGRMLEWGRNEMIIGAGAAKEFDGLDLGNMVKTGPQQWKVVGIFTADGTAAESELWCDAKLLQAAYNRGDSYQSVHLKLTSTNAYTGFTNWLAGNPQLNVRPQTEAQFLSSQSELLTTLITTLGFSIAFLMALGAVFGALNTMYSAVSSRTREIATLRALGFGSGAVVVSLMLESLALALAGGIVGGVVAYAGLNGFHTSSMNWQSFSQVAFSFRVTPALLVQGIIWATAIGLVGGLFPALRAARMPIASALREL